MNWTIGNSGTQNILQSAYIPAPCLNGMQKTANKVGVLQYLNNKDMEEISSNLRKINHIKYNDPDKPIDVEANSRYGQVCEVMNFKLQFSRCN